jgi:redox-sensitive bicupin YhaK (pirin superfamily)
VALPAFGGVENQRDLTVNDLVDDMAPALGNFVHAFDRQARLGRWTTLASPDGADDSLAIRQRAWLRGALLANGQSVDMQLDPARRHWLHVARGAIELDGRTFTAGDALGFVDESGMHRIVASGADTADLLLFDLPA